MELSDQDGTLLGMDADPLALAATRERLAAFGSRLTLRRGFFDSLPDVAAETHFEAVDGILFDLGVSSPQLNVPERGFSFQHNGPLDMRLGPEAEQTAADLVARLSLDELQEVFQRYGEERYSRRIARAIVAQRATEPISTTGRLADIVMRAVPHQSRERIHPATRVFQALRIAVNDELTRLSRALDQAIPLLVTGGRLAVISFHSLEDRIVKGFMRRESRGCICPPGMLVCQCGHTATLRLITRRPLTAAESEIATNPRARSAKLRVAERMTQ